MRSALVLSTVLALVILSTIGRVARRFESR